MQSGSEQLKAWIGKRFPNPRTARTDAADYLGVDYFQLSHWLGGKRGIGMDNALMLAREAGIPVEAWASKGSGKSKPARHADGGKRRLA